MTYHVRVVCETEVGDGKGFHYFTTTQESLDDSIICSTHPAEEVRDFVVESIDES